MSKLSYSTPILTINKRRRIQQSGLRGSSHESGRKTRKKCPGYRSQMKMES